MKLLFMCQSSLSLLNILAKASSSSKFDTHTQKNFLQKIKFLTGKQHVIYENTKYFIIPCIANPFSRDASDEYSAIRIMKASNLTCK